MSAGAAFTLGQAAGIVGGEILRGDARLRTLGVTTDTRGDRRGRLFVPLRGERFDGHDFIGRFAEGGGAAAVTEKDLDASRLPPEFGLVRVANTLKALHDLARSRRMARNIPVIAVTGSAGKTTTKEMIAAALRRVYKTTASRENFNNEIGAPLTLLEMEDDAEAAVLEFGMRGLGQIAELADIARPVIGVVTNVGKTHLGMLGSEENIAWAKGELFEALPPDGTAVVNRDGGWADWLEARARCEVVRVGMDPANHFSADEVAESLDGVVFRMRTPSGAVRLKLPVFGRINVHNALCAAAACMRAGVSLEDAAAGLETAGSAGRRMKRVQARGGRTVIDDTYNSNPASLRAQIDSLSRLDWPGGKALAIGDMLELEPEAEREHEAAGSAIDPERFELLMTFGDLSRHVHEAALRGGFSRSSARHFGAGEFQEALEWLIERTGRGDLILIKGSRGMRMERFVEGLKEEAGA